MQYGDKIKAGNFAAIDHQSRALLDDRREICQNLRGTFKTLSHYLKFRHVFLRFLIPRLSLSLMKTRTNLRSAPTSTHREMRKQYVESEIKKSVLRQREREREEILFAGKRSMRSIREIKIASLSSDRSRCARFSSRQLVSASRGCSHDS